MLRGEHDEFEGVRIGGIGEEWFIAGEFGSGGFEGIKGGIFFFAVVEEPGDGGKPDVLGLEMVHENIKLCITLI